jgi:hypothetical protein
MRPALRLGLLVTWRDRDTVQFGVDARRAVAVTGMSEAADVIGLLDGSRDRDQVIADASSGGVPAAVAERVLTVLAAAGVLIDYPAPLLRSLPVELRRRLLPVLAAASLSGQDSDGGARLIARRTGTTVAVTGCGPVAAAVADLLTRSGLTARREEPGAPGPADLSVLVGRQQPEHIAELVRLGRPHLAVLASDAIGVVGPLVLAQVTGRDPDPSGCDPVLEAAVAAQAAAVAVAVADRAPLAHAAVNGTLELVLPAWQWRRRTWRPHPSCRCGSRAA